MKIIFHLPSVKICSANNNHFMNIYPERFSWSFTMQFCGKSFKNFHECSQKSVKMQKIFTSECFRRWKTQVAKIVIHFDSSKIVKKNVKKPCWGWTYQQIWLVTLWACRVNQSMKIPSRQAGNPAVLRKNSSCVLWLLWLWKYKPNMGEEWPHITNLLKAKAAKPGNKWISF